MKNWNNNNYLDHNNNNNNNYLDHRIFKNSLGLKKISFNKPMLIMFLS